MHFNGFEHWRYVEQSADCEWTFAVFSKVNGPDDVQYLFSFRDKKRTTFGYKELHGTAMWDRNVRKLARNMIAKKATRQALLSDDSQLLALWKRTRS
jgi:hypothetical protein